MSRRKLVRLTLVATIPGLFSACSASGSHPDVHEPVANYEMPACPDVACNPMYDPFAMINNPMDMIYYRP